jgi:DNA (cytosine-5)-methyltransferase 1
MLKKGNIYLLILMKKISSIDLFAGVGGMRISLSKALKKMGFEDDCKLYSEINSYSQQTYQENFPPTKLIEDIKSVKDKDVEDMIPDHDILLAGFPCQPFSRAGISKRKNLKRAHGFDDKDQGDLFFNILSILNIKKPKAFILENVQNLKTYQSGEILKQMLKKLRKNYYVPEPQVLDAQDFGLAQRRRRIFIVGFLKFNGEFKFPKPTYKKTCVKDFLDLYPPKKYIISDLLWDSHKKRKIRNKKAGKGFGFRLTHPTDKATITISARYYKDGSECLLHRGENKNPRKLTPREVFRLQGFPENFKFSVSDLQAYRQAGNAVPINVVEKVCISVLEYLENKQKNFLINKIAS